MAFYVDEEEVWKCPKHPSKRRRTGICPFCLRDKLASLCPDCARGRPCACSATSFSSSFYRFSTAAAEDTSGFGSFGSGGVSDLTEREPAFRRSRSLVIPFLHSKSERLSEKFDLAGNKSSTLSFWSMFKASKKSKRHGSEDQQRGGEKARIAADDERARMMTKSRSVLVSSHSDIGVSKSASTKAKSWYFPSPMKVFRQTRGLVFQERSPLHRGHETAVKQRKRNFILWVSDTWTVGT